MHAALLERDYHDYIISLNVRRKVDGATREQLSMDYKSRAIPRDGFYVNILSI